MCRPSPQKKLVMFLSFMQIDIFDGAIWLCLFPGTYDKNMLSEWLWQVIYRNIHSKWH